MSHKQSIVSRTRYSQNRNGVKMTAPSVLSCFSKNTVPAMKKNPMMQVSPSRIYGSAISRQAVRERQQDSRRAGMGTEKTAAWRNFCRTCSVSSSFSALVEPRHDSCRPVV